MSRDGARGGRVSVPLRAARTVGAALVMTLLLLPAMAVAAPKEDGFVDPLGVWATPVGVMTQYLGQEAPEGWVLAQGQEVSRADYADLFEVLGTTYGAGDGATTFNLPDLRGHLAVGADASDPQFATVGLRGGEKDAAVSVAALPSHRHGAVTDSAGAHTHSITVNSGGAHTHTASTGSAGGHRHESMHADGKRITWQDSMKETGGSGSTHGNAKGTNVQTDTTGAHTHSVTVRSGGAHTHSASSANAGAHTHLVTVDLAGGDRRHPNLQPYVTINHIIKAR